ncbi:MAG: FtsX-like permease family protein [Peptoniphilaceae bacterium]|nr:FtsX-like permease family protein [Peptoniphilaceae bacterium]MDY6018418.1 FtsX-like permease family protein [Anaerococcus sp.]
MNKKTYVKNTLRDMRETKGKILSIFIMIFLASAVIVGLVLTGPTMRKTLNKTLIKYKHPDISLSSSFGLNSEDQVILERDKDIDHITYTKFYDGFLDDNLIRIKSYSKDWSKIRLVKGRFAANDKEIVLDNKLKDSYKIGDQIEIKAAGDGKIEDFLKNTSYKVVGFAKSSEYLFLDIRDISYSAKKMCDAFGLVNKDNFVKDSFGQANIYYKKTKKMNKLSKSYGLYVKDKKKKLEDSLANRPEEVLRKIKDDANEKISKSEKNLNQSELDLNNKEEELNKANKSLDEGFKAYQKAKSDFYEKINEGQKSLDDSKIKLEKGEKSLIAGKGQYLKSLDDFNKQIKEKQDKIDLGKQELAKSQGQLDQGKKAYLENFDKLNNTFASQKEELDLLKISLDEDKEELYKSRLYIENKEKSLKEKKDLLDKYDLSHPEYGDILKQIDVLEKNLERQKVDFETNNKAYLIKNKKYQENKSLYDLSYNEAKKPLDEAKKDLDGKQILIDSKKNDLDLGQTMLDENKKSTQKSFDRAKNDLQSQEQKLKDGQSAYKAGQIKLAKNKKEGEEKLKSSYKELLDKLDQYKKAKNEFDEKAYDARKKIADGKEELEEKRNSLVDIKKPIYDVSYNMDNKAIKTYYNNSSNIDELTKVFPTFFYFVAILVTLTTMKRYIEEQRVHVGTYKSLGYTNSDIANKFYLYGLLPTFVGSFLGTFFGKYVLTKVIFKAYSTSFDVIKLQYAKSTLLSIFTIGLSMVLIYLTIYFTNRKSVNEVTANLLRESAPSHGSRIFLEKVNFIWKRLSFMQKVTFRNLFRYKSRMYMTLFGVAGCTALLFFGFAMQDAIKDTSYLQRNQITHYDAIVVFDPEADQKNLDSLDKAIDRFKVSKIIYQKGKVETDLSKLDVNLMAFDDNKAAKDFINIRDTSLNPLEIKDKGVIITDNLAKKNRFKVGDSLKFKDQANNLIKVKIKGIAENYLEDYIYISKSEYKRKIDNKAKDNADLLLMKDKDDIKDLEEEKAVLTIVKPNSTYKTLDVLMANLNLVIVIITLVSSILAIVVLFNLTNINVSERMRELATTKVLGFYPKETTAYIYRESMILTFLAVILGYGLGYIMFRYVLDVVAPDGIIIAYKPHPKSFIIAFFITFLISLVIMLIVHKRLKSIDMAEAMKSGE